MKSKLTLPFQEYYLWPRPYGDYAREVMEILSSEARNPGHFLRSMILHEFPSVLKEYAYFLLKEGATMSLYL